MFKFSILGAKVLFGIGAVLFMVGAITLAIPPLGISLMVAGGVLLMAAHIVKDIATDRLMQQKQTNLDSPTVQDIPPNSNVQQYMQSNSKIQYPDKSSLAFPNTSLSGNSPSIPAIPPTFETGKKCPETFTQVLKRQTTQDHRKNNPVKLHAASKEGNTGIRATVTKIASSLRVMLFGSKSKNRKLSNFANHAAPMQAPTGVIKGHVLNPHP